MKNPAIRALVATLVGVVVSVIVVMFVEMAGHVIYPPPSDINLADPADQARLMEVIPTGAKIAVVVAWFLGSLAGAWVAFRMSPSIWSGWAVGALMVAAGLWTTQMFPHPTWMLVSAVVLPLIGVVLARELHKRSAAT